jgi:hypothetical protein
MPFADQGVPDVHALAVDHRDRAAVPILAVPLDGEVVRGHDLREPLLCGLGQ